MGTKSPQTASIFVALTIVPLVLMLSPGFPPGRPARRALGFVQFVDVRQATSINELH